MSILVFSIVVLIICGIAAYIVQALPMIAAPFKQIAYAIIGLIALLVILQRSGLLVG